MSLIKELAKQFYVNEKGHLVSNGLSTDLIAFASDMLVSRYNGALQKKINDAMDYATAFVDVEPLNVIRHLPPEVQNDYLTLGLYLYMADEYSRAGVPKTFLASMRDAGAELPVGEQAIRDVLLEKTLAALENAGMKEKLSPVLAEWFEKGTYTINGVVHTVENAEPKGHYAELAKVVSQRQTLLGMNMAISYARGNKQKVETLESEQALYEHTATMVRNPVLITQTIEKGRSVRYHVLEDIIFQAIPQHEIDRAIHKWDENHQQAEAILSYFPEEALVLLIKKGTTLAYHDGESIRGIFPDQKLSGLHQESTEITRDSKGGRLDRYNILFASNGQRANPFDIAADPSLKHRIAAQTLLHETMHMVLDILPQEQVAALEKQVEEVRSAITDGKGRYKAEYTVPLLTIDTNTLAEVLDYTSRLYLNYAEDTKTQRLDSRKEEVICNMLGLCCTEPLLCAQLAETSTDFREIVEFASSVLHGLKTATEVSLHKEEASRGARR